MPICDCASLWHGKLTVHPRNSDKQLGFNFGSMLKPPLKTAVRKGKKTKEISQSEYFGWAIT
jgi:hypothetical protein